MTHQLSSGRRRVGLLAASTAALALAASAGATTYAAGAGPHAGPSLRASSGGAAQGFIDARTDGAQTQVDALRRLGHLDARRTAPRAATRSAAPSVSPFAGQTVLDLDGSTGTVRMLTRLDGFLTGPSTKAPSRIALQYVADHAAELGLSQSDLSTFHLKRSYRDITGAHHLFFVQRVNGRTVFGNGLTASVNRAGDLLTVGGSPISASSLAAAPPASAPVTLGTPGQALAAARGAAPTGANLTQDDATAGLFVTPTGVHPAWQTVVMSSATPALSVLDARTGRVLLRHPLANYEADPDSTGLVYHFFPHAKYGGKQVRVDFTKHHWLGPHATILKGNNSHTYSDVNDNNHPSASEEVHPLRGHSWGYRLQPFHLPWAKSFCSNPWPCSWNPDQARSWQTNRAQNATQVFFYVNNWHDHLEKAPIGFTEAAGNFQQVDHGKHGKGGDPVNTQTDDGANTDRGLPDAAHIDNANMSTPPDGHQPVMQMYLQHEPGTPYSLQGDPFSPTNVGDEADTVYHEYTHGLSNRLNVDVQGASTLGGVQAGAMGEAWSDWYAMDYLVDRHLQTDRPHRVDVRLFRYDGLGVRFDRTEPMDCPVGSKDRLCQGGDTGHRGGYTYLDYGKVVGFPEVHSDGEIWAQTLWSLRDDLGSSRTEGLVTRAMELAPYNPSFLDMRNAILVADTSLHHGADRGTIWKVFASRGMGFFAGSLGGNDSTPGASFAMPPAQLALQNIQGTVTRGGAPVANVAVTLAFQGSGTANPTAVTDSSGHYEIDGVPEGSYAKLQARGGGFHGRKSVTVSPSGATVNFGS